MNKKLQHQLPLIAILLALPAVALPQPTVSGNTLSWPGDGWYQVQRADTYETVCEGSVASTSSVSGGPCVIDSSQHIVINHRNGERFENITAGDASVSAVSVDGITVEGGRISWPDDGWY